MRSKRIAAMLCLAVAAGAVFAQSQPKTQTPAQPQAKTQSQAPASSGDDAALDQLRKDLRGDKTQIIAEAMGFTADEAAAFWPLYKSYEKEQTAVGDEKVAAIKDYAANYDKMTDAKATELIGKVQAIEDKATAEKRGFIKSLQGVLPAKRVARYYQVESRIQLLMDLGLASQIPLVK
jgi:hypothetical protein